MNMKAFTLRHKLKLRNSTFIAVLHFSHSSTSNNEHKSYSKMNVKWSLAWCSAILFTFCINKDENYFKIFLYSSLYIFYMTTKNPCLQLPFKLFDWCSMSTLTVFQLYHGPCILNTNAAIVDVYSIPHYVIKFVSDLRQSSGFLSQ